MSNVICWLINNPSVPFPLRPLSFVFRLIAATIILAAVSACTPYIGDSLLRLSDQPGAYGPSKTISEAKAEVSGLLDKLGLSEDAKIRFKKISPKSIIHDSAPLKLTRVGDQLIVAGSDADIAFATNSIIISTGAVHISHSGNNIVVCGSDVGISHDGSLGNGSLVISKGKTKISHARNTLICAIKGVKISHPHNVQVFNPRECKTSW